MSVPTHGPDCATKAYKTKCPYCRDEVYFFACSCGTKVFFDDLGYPWPQHHCTQYEIIESIKLLRDIQRLTDDEIFRRIVEHGKIHGKPISQEHFEIIDNELSRRKKEFKFIEVKFDEQIQGVSGQIVELNPKVNFIKRLHHDPNAPFIKNLLGELLITEFTEIIIRDSPDKNNHSRQYSVYIKSSELKSSGVHRSDFISVKVRGSKTVEKFWIVSNIQKV